MWCGGLGVMPASGPCQDTARCLWGSPELCSPSRMHSPGPGWCSVWGPHPIPCSGSGSWVSPCARSRVLRAPLSPQCSPGGCFIELAQELLVIMVGKQIINNVQEVAIP